MGLGSGPCFTLFCLAEQTAPGRKRKRGEARIEGSARGTAALSPCGRLGGPDARGTEGALFVLCRQNGGSCCCLWASARPRVRLYRIPPVLHLSTTSLPRPLPQNDRHSLTHTRPSISSARSAGGVQCFVDAQESEQSSSQRKRGLLLCRLPGKSAFYCH